MESLLWVAAMSRGCLLSTGFGLLGLVIAGCGQSPASKSLPFQNQVAAAQKETDAELRATQLIKIGRRQGQARDVAGAKETLELATKDCQAIADAVAQATTLALLAETQAGLGNRPAARDAINLAMAAADQVKEAEAKGLVLARIAQAQGAAGDAEGGADYVAVGRTTGRQTG